MQLLIKNIIANKVQNKIFVFPYPLNKDDGINKFKFSSTTEEHAMSSFGVNYGSEGLKKNLIIPI